MTALTETVLPLTPFKYEIPEDLTKSSERVVHFWLGAMSPLWLPFAAATSLGVGAWVMGRCVANSIDALGDTSAFKGFLSVEKALDEGVAAPIQAFIEVEATMADQVMADYSPSKEAIAAAYRAEAEAAVDVEVVAETTAEVTETATPLPIAQNLAIAPNKSRPRSRRS